MDNDSLCTTASTLSIQGDFCKICHCGADPAQVSPTKAIFFSGFKRRHVVNYNLSSSMSSFLFVAITTLILGYKGHKESAQLVLTLILLDILTSFDP